MRFLLSVALASALLLSCNPETESSPEVAVGVSFPESMEGKPMDGRLLLMLSDDPSAEPRFQINTGLNTQLIFGMNVEGMQPGEVITFDQEADGFPYKSLTEVPWTMGKGSSGTVRPAICTVSRGRLQWGKMA
ncbi:MAG: hypothetical protein P8Z38_10155 [Robiginitalea sp.]